jgi:hypothetical protein
VQLVLATQQSTWHTPDTALQHRHWMTYRCQMRHPPQALAVLLDSLNGRMVRVAAALRLPLLRTDSLLAPTSEHFFDDCHFTPHGNARFARLVTAQLAALP